MANGIEKQYAVKFTDFIIANWFTKPGKLLDIGCGLGYYSDSFEKNGFACTRMDLVSGEKIIQRNLNVDKIGGIYTEKFDYVFARSIIEYLKDPISFVEDCKSVLKPGGKIFILTPNWEQEHSTFYDNYRRESPFTLRSLKMLMEDSKFRTEYVECYGDIKLLWRYSQRAFHKDANGPWVIYIGTK